MVVTVEDPYEGADPPRRLPLVPNMQVGLTFTGASIDSAIAVPEASFHAGLLRIVDAKNRLELRPVTPDFPQDDHIVIARGLIAGDRIVVDDIAPAIPGLALDPIEVTK